MRVPSWAALCLRCTIALLPIVPKFARFLQNSMTVFHLSRIFLSAIQHSLSALDGKFHGDNNHWHLHSALRRAVAMPSCFTDECILLGESGIFLSSHRLVNIWEENMKQSTNIKLNHARNAPSFANNIRNIHEWGRGAREWPAVAGKTAGCNLWLIVLCRINWSNISITAFACFMHSFCSSWRPESKAL